MNVERYMTVAPVTVGYRQSIAEAAELLSRWGVHHLPVLDGERPIGMLSEAGLSRLQARKRVDAEVLSVLEAMDPGLVVVRPDDALLDVARRMVAEGSDCALVIDASGSLRGIFTATDGLRALADLSAAEQRRAATSSRSTSC